MVAHNHIIDSLPPILEPGATIPLPLPNGQTTEIMVNPFSHQGKRYTREVGAGRGSIITVFGDDLWRIEGRSWGGELVCRSIRHHKNATTHPEFALIPDRKEWFALVGAEMDWELPESSRYSLIGKIRWEELRQVGEGLLQADDESLMGERLLEQGTMEAIKWRVEGVHRGWRRPYSPELVSVPLAEGGRVKLVSVGGHIDTTLSHDVYGSEWPAITKLTVVSERNGGERMADLRSVQSWAYTASLESLILERLPEFGPPKPKMEAQYLYRFFDDEGELLYVGITSDLTSRWRDHSKDKPWFDDVAVFTREKYSTRRAVEEAEIAAIRAERPRYNIAYSTASRVA